MSENNPFLVKKKESCEFNFPIRLSFRVACINSLTSPTELLWPIHGHSHKYLYWLSSMCGKKATELGKQTHGTKMVPTSIFECSTNSYPGSPFIGQKWTPSWEIKGSCEPAHGQMFPSASVLKQVFLRNWVAWKWTRVVGSHMNYGFAFRLVLTRRQKTTRKWPAYWMNVEKVVNCDTDSKFFLTNIQTAFMEIWMGLWSL